MSMEPSAAIKAVFSSLGLKYSLESTRAHVVPTELGDFFNFDPSSIVRFLVSVYNLYNYKGQKEILEFSKLSF